MIVNFFGRQVYVRKELIALIIPILVILLGFSGYVISSGSSAEIIKGDAGNKPVSEVEKIQKEATQADTDKLEKVEKDRDEIKVYVVGCVNNPGVVAVKKGDILEEAIKLAGGMTDEADPNGVNLAYKLKDNVMIHIRSRQEIQASTSRGQQAQTSGEEGQGVEVVTDSGGAIVGSSIGDKAPKKVNINTSSANELETLPGIGKETAKDIISYREKNGAFNSINDIMKISGIKDSRFSKIKDLIAVD